jgi:hypothetical protein
MFESLTNGVDNVVANKPPLFVETIGNIFKSLICINGCDAKKRSPSKLNHRQGRLQFDASKEESLSKTT